MTVTTPSQPLGYFAGIEPQIHYWAAYTWPFGGPNKWMNLLLFGVCMLIPIVGPIVLIGYLIEVMVPRLNEEWPGWSKATHTPDFNFSRFTEYLTRGLWPFLVSLVMQFVMMVPAFLVMFVGIFAIGAAARNTPVVVLLFVLMMLAFWGVMAVGMLLTVPPSIRAALLQDFGPAFSLDWIKDFVSRTWKKLLLSMLFLLGTGIVLALCGYAMCFVGVYPAMGLMIIAQWHLNFQIYRVYLARGGVPVPAKGVPPPITAPMPMPMPMPAPMPMPMPPPQGPLA